MLPSDRDVAMVTFKEWCLFALVVVCGGSLGWGLGALGLGPWLAIPVCFVFAVGWGVLALVRDVRRNPWYYGKRPKDD